MSEPNSETSVSALEQAGQDESSFAEILSNFEQQHADGDRGQTVTGTIVSVGPEAVMVDVGRKIEGSLPLARWAETELAEPKPGAHVSVTIGPRNEEGYYSLSTIKVERPKDWSGLEAALRDKQNIAGTVVEQVKGGFRVDVGVRAFMPASRSGVRDADEMGQLVGREIQCRITKLDTAKEDVVVDRRVILEEEQSKKRTEVFSGLREGSVVRGRVRSLMDFGAFLDLGGVDGLLHVADMAYTRIVKASDLVKIGDELEVKVLKVDPQSRKISLGLKQMQEDPWTVAVRTLHVGDRATGTVSRLADFGAFIELIPGVDGLIHLSELSWDKRVRKPGDLLKVGDRVEAVILQVNAEERRIGLGYKQVLGDPWDLVPAKFPIGATVEGTVTNLTPFGGFVDLNDGIEGMIHISDITNEKRLDHPKDKLAKGQQIRAVVLELDKDRRRIRLGMKQLEPTTLDHYIAEHSTGETVSGRLVEVKGNQARVELGEGVIADCEIKVPERKQASVKASPQKSGSQKDVSSLSAMLAARWKQGAGPADAPAEVARAGEVRSFRIAALDATKRLIEIELAS